MFDVNNYVSRARISALLGCWDSRLSIDCFRCVKRVAPDGYQAQNDSFVEYPLNGGYLVFEDESKTRWDLDEETIRRGLSLMPEKATKAWCDFLLEREDAETAFVFVQLALFGKLVYG